MKFSDLNTFPLDEQVQPTSINEQPSDNCDGYPIRMALAEQPSVGRFISDATLFTDPEATESIMRQSRIANALYRQRLACEPATLGEALGVFVELNVDSKADERPNVHIDDDPIYTDRRAAFKQVEWTVDEDLLDYLGYSLGGYLKDGNSLYPSCERREGIQVPSLTDEMPQHVQAIFKDMGDEGFYEWVITREKALIQQAETTTKAIRLFAKDMVPLLAEVAISSGSNLTEDDMVRVISNRLQTYHVVLVDPLCDGMYAKQQNTPSGGSMSPNSRRIFIASPTDLVLVHELVHASGATTHSYSAGGGIITEGYQLRTNENGKWGPANLTEGYTHGLALYIAGRLNISAEDGDDYDALVHRFGGLDNETKRFALRIYHHGVKDEYELGSVQELAHAFE